ncbi:unnamed protein product [Adineta ricciae]|uniref:G protein-coupled receptor n=1 Tax=Adineta ricciae TaxID=249248 RepID=A0A813UK51_ADIRI|nr:unnamed protein product [Adineta ricciae]
MEKDFHIDTIFEETFYCRFRSYLLWTSIGQLYWNYVLLAFFHFVRVVHPKRLYLHRPSLYLFIFIPLQSSVELVGNLPVLFLFDGIHLLPNEAYCSLVLRPFYILLYVSTIGFFIPYGLLCTFNVWIGREIRQSTTRALRERNQRDYLVIRRMLMNSFILCGVTVPYFVLYIKGVLQNRFDGMIYRVQWLSSSLSSCLFCLSLPLIATQLRDLLKSYRTTAVKDQI